MTSIDRCSYLYILLVDNFLIDGDNDGDDDDDNDGDDDDENDGDDDDDENDGDHDDDGDEILKMIKMAKTIKIMMGNVV